MENIRGHTARAKECCISFITSLCLVVRAPDATLCPLQSGTSTMMSPSPTVLHTPSTAAWAAAARVTDDPVCCLEWFCLIFVFLLGSLIVVICFLQWSPWTPARDQGTDAKVTRFGRTETPSYSILGRGKRTNEGIKNEKVSHQNGCLLVSYSIYLLHFLLQ